MEPDQETDELVAVLPIHLTNALAPNVQLHQFPLLSRPLQVPPSAKLSGKQISGRIKPDIRRLELHVPADTRTEVWNTEKARNLGAAQIDDDVEKKQERQKPREDEEPRLNEIRLQNERIPQRGAQMLGVMRNGMFRIYATPLSSPKAQCFLGRLNLHPIGEAHQFRPTLTYLDILSRRDRRSRLGGSDSETDNGPPLDPEELPPVDVPKRDKKAPGPGKEIQVSARRGDDKGSVSTLGGLSAVRRDMLRAIRAEEDEEWCSLHFFDTLVGSLLSKSQTSSDSKVRPTNLRQFLKRYCLAVQMSLLLKTTLLSFSKISKAYKLLLLGIAVGF